MRWFLRETTVGREPLAVTMSAARLGERLLQIGVDDPRIAGMLAAKPGLSGHSAIAAGDEATARARKAAEHSGAAVDVMVGSLERLPFEDNAFDLVVIHNRDGRLAGLGTGCGRLLGECRRVLRSGGRLVVLEKGSPSGLKALLRSRDSQGGADTTRELEASGFRAVRILGDRDDYRFIEGMNVDDQAASPSKG